MKEHLTVKKLETGQTTAMMMIHRNQNQVLHFHFNVFHASQAIS